MFTPDRVDPSWRSSSLFSGLPAATIDALEALAIPQGYTPGESLFPMGGEAEDLRIVASGEVELTLPLLVSGFERHIVIGEKTAGQICGWSAWIPPHRFTLAARARDDTVVIALPREKVRAKFAADPETRAQLMTNLAQVVAERLTRIESILVRQLQRRASQALEAIES